VYLLVLGCNVWLVLLLTLSGWLGISGSRWHLLVSLFAAVFTALVHGGTVALFLGGGKLVKEHIGRFNMPMEILDRLNRIYAALIPRAILGATTMPVVGVVGGLAGTGYLPLWTHWTLAAAAYLYLLWLPLHEYRWLKRFHGIVREVDRRLPPDGAMEEAAPHPDYRPDEVVLDARGRARALLYIGLTIPVPYLGYHFIVGLRVAWLLVPTVLLTALCLGSSAYYYRRARRAAA
jgi:hypothetical protein